MTLPLDEVGICNIASDFVGGERVSNIYSPTTTTEKIFGRHYDAVRQETLREYVPNFAKTRATLAKLAASPDFDYTDAYQLPADFIRLLSVGGDREEYSLDTSLYDLSGDQLLVDNGGGLNINIRYIKDEKDVRKWDSLFRNLMSMRLADAVVVQLCNDTRKVAALQAKIDKKMATILGVDAQEKPPTVIDESAILARRRGLNGRVNRDNRYLNTYL